MREKQFIRTRLGRRGLDPDEVRAFLDRVAGDLAGLYASLGRLNEENERVKRALRDWQSMHAQMCHPGPPPEPGSGLRRGERATP